MAGRQPPASGGVALSNESRQSHSGGWVDAERSEGAARSYRVRNPVTVAPQPRRAEVKRLKDPAELERVAIELGERGDTSLGAPAVDTLTRRVVPVERSRTKMSHASLVSPMTRLDAPEANAM